MSQKSLMIQNCPSDNKNLLTLINPTNFIKEKCLMVQNCHLTLSIYLIKVSLIADTKVSNYGTQKLQLQLLVTSAGIFSLANTLEDDGPQDCLVSWVRHGPCCIENVKEIDIDEHVHHLLENSVDFESKHDRK